MFLLFLVTVYAVRRGGTPERAAAFILVSLPGADFIYHSFPGLPGIYDSVDPVHAAFDGVALVAMVWLALRTDRVWTLWLAGLQVIASMSHVVRATDVEMGKIVYAILIRWPFVWQILLVGLGTWLHARRQRREAQLVEGRSSPVRGGGPPQVVEGSHLDDPPPLGGLEEGA